MADLAAVTRLPFEEQIAAFRLRLGNLVPTQAWDDLQPEAHDRAFMVAGAMKADLLADLAGAVDKAISQGTSLEAFQRDFREIVSRNGWHGWTGEGTKAGEFWRTRVIYRTNMMSTYAAGRMAQLREAKYPLWVYRHGAALEPRQHHLALDGLVLPPDHPFWLTHAPPNGWGCTCYILGARDDKAALRLGGKPGMVLPDGWDNNDPRTGVPAGIDKGWAYAPGRSVAQMIGALSTKLAQLPAPLGADLVAGWNDKIVSAWVAAFRDFVSVTLAERVDRGRNIVVGALKPEWIEALNKVRLAPATAEIMISEKTILHMYRTVKARPVDPDWLAGLPRHLRSPVAVILQEGRQPNLLLVYDQPGKATKLVVELDYYVKRERQRFNMIKSGSEHTINEIRSLLGKGKLLEGNAEIWGVGRGGI